jgi:hypothetical protein
MFKPASLISAPCTPKVFDFHTVSREDIIEFTIDIEFIVAQTSLCHGVDLFHTPIRVAKLTD